MAGGSNGPTLLGIRAEFFLFAITLIGVALLHHQTLQVALTGLVSILLFKFTFTDFHLVRHLHHEWEILVNLLGLLLGFAILAKHFEESRVPAVLPRFLPDDWKGGFVLLVLVCVLSSFLDNIAAAMIGGTIAGVVFKHRLHIGFLAAIVASSNAGGAGSVVGDTTTTMMWIDGVAPLDVAHAFVGSAVAIVVSGIVAAKQQHRFQPIESDAVAGVKVDWVKIGLVALILAGAITANFALDFPAVGVWVAIALGACFSKTSWRELPGALRGSLFLLSLVMCASMMPVEELPKASWQTAFGLGFVSAVFDNIPLTKLALDQGGYDWGVLAFTVGYGGSMIWFGSSAGVALSNIFPEAKSVGAWLKHGWHVTVAYILAVVVMLLIVGWHPHAPHKKEKGAAPVSVERPR
ncbi:MAG: citrate transporter [Verrucomicrobia bacterium]|nr:citrate transporter [Verrucomicrobiota bacterium]